MPKSKTIKVTFKSGAKKCDIKIKHIDQSNCEVSVFWTPYRPPAGEEEMHEIMAINYLKLIAP